MHVGSALIPLEFIRKIGTETWVVNLKCSHNRPSGTLKIEELERQIIKSLGAIEPKGLNRRANIR
jgi:hypothetical protein